MNIAHPFSKEKKIAGVDWLYHFRKRHPNLSLRAPEPTSIARAASFNKVQVTKFYDLFSSVMKKYKFQADQIYNADETGMNTVPKPRKIVAQKGRKQEGCIVSTERGFNVTVTCAISASGSYISPFVRFPRKRMSELLIKGCPAGIVGYANSSGWMDSEHFLKYLEHFAKHARASENRKVLLIIDDHSSHRNLDAILKARSLNIVMISLPPHTSHRMQLLGCSFYGPLKGQYARECDKWLSNDPAQRISIYVMEIFGKAFLKVATLKKAVKGFYVTGICLLNPDVFPDTDFLPSSVTENPQVTADLDNRENDQLNAEPLLQHSHILDNNPELVPEDETVQSGLILRVPSTSRKLDTSEPVPGPSTTKDPPTSRKMETSEPTPGPSTAKDPSGDDFEKILATISPKPKCKRKAHSPLLLFHYYRNIELFSVGSRRKMFTFLSAKWFSTNLPVRPTFFPTTDLLFLGNYI